MPFEYGSKNTGHEWADRLLSSWRVKKEKYDGGKINPAYTQH